MTVTVRDIISLMEEVAPPRLAESWDNAGLQIGKRSWPVSRIMTALDPSPQVIDDALNRNVDLLITHHPLLFTPLKAIDLDTAIGALVARAVTRRLAVYAAHTNLDSVCGGLNDELARRLELVDLSPLVPAPAAVAGHDPGGRAAAAAKSEGLGRVGTLPKQIPLLQLGLRLKGLLPADHVRMVGNAEMMVQRVAVCSGSGASLLDAFYASGAQVYISGDLGYHHARTAEAIGVGLLDIGHFASEHLVTTTLSGLLEKQCADHGISVSIHPCDIEKNPFVVL
jgi:dinuclear metal center YbgI/SA1388 family protein